MLFRSPVLIRAPLLRLKGFATTPMLAMVARGYERGSSSTSSSLISSSYLGASKSSFKGSLPLLLLVETMVLLKLGDRIWLKQIETKTQRKHEIRTSGVPGDYILRSFITKGRYGDEAWSETDSEGPTPPARAARVGPAPREIGRAHV